MKRIFGIALVLIMVPAWLYAQNYPHYTMFMYNKLLYNPAYAGNKDLTSVNAAYRSQWVGIDGAPKTFSVAIDGPVGNYMKPFRRVALGLVVSNEKLGVANNTNLMATYAYRIPLNKTILSFGLQAGASLFSARYSELKPYQGGDARLTNDVKNAALPNVGAGVYWSGENFYVSAAVPSLLENYYDKDHKEINNSAGKQIRSYFIGGGYVFPVGENVKLEPQVMARYAGNGNYQLPFNADLNLSCILYDRLMIGATYRTDQSFEGIVHIQATKNINLGYAYDYTISGLNGYNNGSHEIVVGFDFIRDNNKYTNPRFIKPF